MVNFTEKVGSKQDHYFVKEDPARIYRGLKDVLVEEFDVDRIEEGHMEFNVNKPKDKINLWAFKEKSPHTTIMLELKFRAKRPKDFYKVERSEDILKAGVKTSAKVMTVYPGGNPIPWEPEPLEQTDRGNFNKPGLQKEGLSSFQKSKFYEIMVGIWYNKFYSKEIHRYEEEAEEMMVHVQNLMRRKFGVEETIHRSGAGHYSPPWS